MIRRGIGWAVITVSVILSIYIRFSNPELTETQLFLEFAPVWIAIVIVLLWGLFWVTRK